jgi:type II secretion system protein J
MTPALPFHPRARAFTLLEVLLAVAVFAIVLAAINSVFFAALRLRNKTAEAFEAALPLSHALAVLKGDLAGLMPPSGGALAGQLQSAVTSNATVTLTGERVSPDLFTCSAIVDDTSPFSEVQKVAYYLAIPTNNSAGRDLVRLVTRNLLPTLADEPAQQWLMSGVETMLFQYYDGTQWLDTWDSTTASNLPLAVKVQIELASNPAARRAQAPIELVVPIMVQGRTNQTQQATGGGQ